MMNRVSKTPVVNRQNINNSHVCYSTIREMDGKVVHYGVVSKREYFYHKQLMEERMARTKYISSEHRTRSQFMAENRTSEELRASKIYHAAGESSEKTAYLSGERNVVAVSSSYSRKRVERGGIVRFGRRLVTTTTYEEEVEKIIFIQLWWRRWIMIKRQREEERRRRLEIEREELEKKEDSIHIEMTPEIKQETVLRGKKQSPMREEIEINEEVQIEENRIISPKKFEYRTLQPQTAIEESVVHEKKIKHLTLKESPEISQTLSSHKPKFASELIQPETIDINLSTNVSKLYYKEKIVPIWKEESKVKPQEEETSQLRYVRAAPPKVQPQTSFKSLTAEDIWNDQYKGIPNFQKWISQIVPENETQNTLTFTNRKFDQIKVESPKAGINLNGDGSSEYYKGKIAPIWRKENEVNINTGDLKVDGVHRKKEFTTIEPEDRKKKITLNPQITKDYYKEKMKRIWKEENEIQQNQGVCFNGEAQYKKWNRGNSSHKLYENTVVSKNKAFEIDHIQPSMKSMVKIEAEKRTPNIKTFKVVDNENISVNGKSKRFDKLEEGYVYGQAIEGEPAYKKWNKRNASTNPVVNNVKSNYKRFNEDEIKPAEKRGLSITSYKKTFGPVDVQGNENISVKAQPKRFDKLEENGIYMQQLEGEPAYKKWNRRNSRDTAYDTTLTSTNKTFGTVSVDNNGEISVDAEPRKFKNIQRGESLSKEIEGESYYSRWNKRIREDKPYEESVVSKNKKFEIEYIRPDSKDSKTIISHNKTFDPVNVQASAPISVKAEPRRFKNIERGDSLSKEIEAQPRRFKNIERGDSLSKEIEAQPRRFKNIQRGDSLSKEIEGESYLAKWNKRIKEDKPYEGMVVSQNKTFNINSIRPDSKDSKTITSHHKTFDPITVEENQPISVKAEPRRFKSIERGEDITREIEGEPIYAKWNKNVRSSKPTEETVVSKNKKFEIEYIRPDSKDSKTIISHHKTFDPVEVQGTQPIDVKATPKPKRFDKIERGESLTKEIEGEPAYAKWNKRIREDKPYDESVVSENKTFNIKTIKPAEKEGLTITSTNKTFGPVKVQDNEQVSVDAQPRRFKSIERGESITKEIEGEPTYVKWNKKVRSAKPTEETVVYQNKKFNENDIIPSSKQSTTITSHHKSFDPVEIQGSQPIAVKAEPRRFKNIERGDSLSKEIEAQPRRFKNIERGDSLSKEIEAQPRRFKNIERGESLTKEIEAEPRRFKNIQRGESLTKEIEGEPTYAKWNKRIREEKPYDNTVVSDKKTFNIKSIRPDSKDSNTITSHHKTFDPVYVEENQPLSVRAQPRRFKSIERGENITKEIEGEPIYAKWNKNVRSAKPTEETVVSKNKKFDEERINPTDKQGLTITSTNKTFGPVTIQENTPFDVDAQPRRFKSIERGESLTKEIEGEPIYAKWNKNVRSAKPSEETVVSKNKKFDVEQINPADKEGLTITSTNKTFGPVTIQENTPLDVDAQPRRFKSIERGESLTKEIEGEPIYAKWNKKVRSAKPTEETVVSKNKKFDEERINPTDKQGLTITSTHKTFGPVTIQENTPLDVDAQPRRFKNIQRGDSLSKEIEGESHSAKWNKRIREDKPYEESVVSKNKKFDEEGIKPADKGQLSITSTHKTFGPVNVQENEGISVDAQPRRFKSIERGESLTKEIDAQPRRFKNIERGESLTKEIDAQPRRFKNIQRGDSLSKEIEGEPIYAKWNKRIREDKPYDDSVVSKNKKFEIEYIRPDSKDSKTITSHHKTFDPVSVEENQPVSVNAQPRRFKSIERGEDITKEIEGEPIYAKWNKKVRSAKPTEETVVSKNKKFDEERINPTDKQALTITSTHKTFGPVSVGEKEGLTITSHHKTFDPVSIEENQPLSVRAQPRRFKNIERGDSLSKEIEGEPAYVKWNKNVRSAKPTEETVVSKNKKFEIEYIRPDSKDSKTITSHHKTFDPVNVQASEPISVKAEPRRFKNIERGDSLSKEIEAQPRRFKNIERGDSVSKEIEGEPTYVKWNKRIKEEKPYEQSVVSENKTFNIKSIKPDFKDSNTITSHHKTFDPVNIQESEPISVAAQPRRFKSIERGESLTKEIEGEPIYAKWNKNVRSAKPTEETVVSKNKKFEVEHIRPVSKDSNTITSHHKTFDPVTVEENEPLSVRGQPKRFKELHHRNVVTKGEIEGEPIPKRWNKHNIHENPFEQMVVSENKTFNIQKINPVEKDALTITSTNKTFGPVKVQENTPLSVDAQPRRFKSIERGESLTKEIEGEPIYAKWNKRIRESKPYDDTVVSENKKFKESEIKPTEKDGLTVTSHHKTFDPVYVEENQPISVDAQPRRFKSIERGESLTKEIEGEPIYAKWNKNVRSAKPTEETVVSKNKKFDVERINPTEKEGLTITSHHKTFDPVTIQENTPIDVDAQPRRFKSIERGESLTKEIEGEPAYVKWNKNVRSAKPTEETVVSKNKKFEIEYIRPDSKDSKTITSHHKTFDPVSVEENQPVSVNAQPRRFKSIERGEDITKEIEGEPIYAKWNKKVRSAKPTEETVVSKNKKFDEERINPTDKQALTITSTHKTFGPVNVQENEGVSVDAQPRRFKSIERGESLTKEIEGEPIYAKWNKNVRSSKPSEETVVSKNKKFDEEQINPAEKAGLTITSTNKTFGPVNVQENEGVSVGAQPRRFKSIERGESLTKEIEGEPIYAKWNKKVRSAKPTEETVVSKNKKFDEEKINPTDKQGLTITSTNKTFGPVSIQENTPLDVDAQPRRFKNIERGDSMSKEIEGEPAYAKWNKRIREQKPYDESVVSENKTFNIKTIKPDFKDSNTITSHHKTFDPVNVQGSEPISVDAQPRRFKNIERGDSVSKEIEAQPRRFKNIERGESLTKEIEAEPRRFKSIERGENLTKEIEGEPIYAKWNKNVRSTKPTEETVISKNKKFDKIVPQEGTEETVVSKNKKFDVEQINPADKEGLTITSHHKTFDPVNIQENEKVSVDAQPRRFKSIERGEDITKEIEGEPIYAKWNKKVRSAKPTEETVVSKNKKFDVEQINPAEKEGLTITSTNKTFGPVTIQENTPLDVDAQPRRFKSIERGESLTKEIEGEPIYAKWNKNVRSAKPTEETVVSKNKKFDVEQINPADKEGLTITSTNKTFGPVTIQENTPLDVDAQPRRFKSIERGESLTKEIEGEPIYAKWNKNVRSAKPSEETVVSKNKKFDEEQINPTDKQGLTITSTHKTFGPVTIQENTPLDVDAQPRRFKNIQRGDSLSKEIEGESHSAKWNKRIREDKPYDESVVSENKKFKESQIEPSAKSDLTITSHNKTFDPVTITESEPLSVAAQPRRFKTIERGSDVSKEIEGEPTYAKWNKKIRKESPYDGTVTSHHKTFDPVDIQENAPLSVRGEPKRFKNLSKTKMTKGEIEGEPIAKRWNKHNISTTPIDEGVSSKNKCFDITGITPVDKDGYTITSSTKSFTISSIKPMEHEQVTLTSSNKRFNETAIKPIDKSEVTLTSHVKTFDPVSVVDAEVLDVQGKPKRFDNLEETKNGVEERIEFEGEPVYVRWNIKNTRAVPKDLKRTVTSEKKTFNQTAFETTEKDGFTISSYNKTFGPVNVQDNENILVEAQPKRFKSLERNEMQGQQIEGEPAYKKWNKRNASANPYDATLTSTNKSFDIKGIKPGDKEGITLTSENKTFNISRIRQDDKDEMTITSSHKTFGPVDVDNNGEISVGAQPRRFKNIERGESLSKEIEGEPIYEKWNKSVVNTMPTQETVVSKNKKFDEGEIRPASKDGNTITSHHKTFDPVNVQGSEGISVSGEPRRFKNIERGDSLSKEIEGEPTFRKWNKRIREQKPYDESVVSENKTFNIKTIKPDFKDSNTITSHHKTFDPVNVQGSEPILVKAEPRRFKNIERGESLTKEIEAEPRRFKSIERGEDITKEIEGEPIYAKWNKNVRSTKPTEETVISNNKKFDKIVPQEGTEETVISKNKKFDLEQINPAEKEGLTITSHHKTFDPVEVQGSQPIAVRGVPKPKKFDRIEPEEGTEETVVSKNKKFDEERINPTDKQGLTITSTNKTFGPVTIQENTPLDVDAQPRRFKSIERGESLTKEIEGEPIYAKWNKNVRSAKPSEETVVSKNKKFDVEQINPADKEGLTITSTNKTFGPVTIQENTPLDVDAQPRRFKSIERGESLTKEIEGEPIYAKWNKNVRSAKPTEETVESKNKKFDVERINPTDKQGLTITSTNKTFGPVTIQENTPLDVDAQPRRFKNIQRGDSLSKEIEGESHSAKWNKRIREDKPYEEFVVSENKTFNIKTIKPDFKDSNTITSHHKTFDPVNVQGSEPISVDAQPRRFKNIEKGESLTKEIEAEPRRFKSIERGESLTKEIEGEPIYAKWNKNVRSTKPTEETVVSKNKKFDEERINPAEKEGLTITSTNKTFGPVTVQENTPVAVRGVPKAKKFDVLVPKEVITKGEIEGEPIPVRWNKENISETPIEEVVVSENKSFNIRAIKPSENNTSTITSHHKTFDPVEVQGSQPIAVKAQPKRFNNIERGESLTKEIEAQPRRFKNIERGDILSKEIEAEPRRFKNIERGDSLSKEIEGEPTYVKWNKRITNTQPTEETVVSKNKKFDEERINPTDKQGLTITSTNKTFGPVTIQENTPLDVDAQPRRFKSIERGESLTKEIEGEPIYAKWNKNVRSAKPSEETVVSKNKKFDVEQINPADKEGITITSNHKTFDPVEVQASKPIAVEGVPKAKKFDRIEPEEGVEETVISKNKKFDEEKINPAEKEGLTITSTNKTFGPVNVQENTPLSVDAQPRRFKSIERGESLTKEIEGEPIYAKWNKNVRSIKPTEETVVSKNKKFDVEQINPAEKEGLTITSHHKTFDPVEVQASNPIAVHGVPKEKKFDRIEPQEGVEETVVSKNKKFDVEQINPADKEGLTITSTNKTFGPITIQENTPLDVDAQPRRFKSIERGESLTKEIEGEPIYAKWNKNVRSAKPTEETVVSKNKKFDEERINPAEKEGLTITSTNKTFGPVTVQENTPVAVRGVPKAKKFDRIEPEEGVEETVVSKNKKFDVEQINPADKEGLTITSTNKTFGPVEMQGSTPIAVRGVPKAKKFDRIEPEETKTEQIEGEPAFAKWNKRNSKEKPYGETVISEKKSFNIKAIKLSEEEGNTITSTNKTFGPVEMQGSAPIAVKGVPKAKKFDRIEPEEGVTKEIEGEPTYAKWNKRIREDKPYDDSIVSKNKKFEVEYIRPDSKDSKTITSHHKTFDPVNVQASEPVIVKAEPRRFKNIERGDSLSKEIEGEPTYVKWNKRITNTKPTEETVISKNKKFDVLVPKEVITKGEIEGEPIPVRWNKENISETPIEDTVVSENKTFNIKAIKPAEREVNTVISDFYTFEPDQNQILRPVAVRAVRKPKRFEDVVPEESTNEQIHGEPAYAKWNKRNSSTKSVEETVVSKNKKFDKIVPQEGTEETVVSKNKKFDVERINPADKEGLTITSTNKTFGPVEMQGNEAVAVEGVPKAKKFDRIEPEEGIEETVVSKNKKFDRIVPQEGTEETVVSKNKKFDVEQINPAEKEGLTITSHHKTFDPVEVQGTKPIAVRGVPKAKKFDRIEPEEGVTKQIEGEPAYAKWNKRNSSTNPVDEKVVSKNKKFDVEQINPAEKEGLTITSTNKTFGPVEMQGSAPLAVRGVPKAKKFDRIEPEEGVEETVVSKNKKFDVEQINPADKEGLTITSTNKTFGPVEMQGSTPIDVRGVPKAKKFDRIEPEEGVTKQIEGEPTYAKWNKRNSSTNPVDEKVVSKNKKFDVEQINPADKEGLTITSTNKTFGPVEMQGSVPIAVRGVPKAKKFDRIEPEETKTEQIEGEPAYAKWNKRNASTNPVDETVVSQHKTFGPVRVEENETLAVKGVPKAKKFDRIVPEEGVEETVVSKNKKFDVERINPAEKEGITITSHHKTFDPVEVQGSQPIAVEGVPKAKKFDRIEPEETKTEQIEGEPRRFKNIQRGDSLSKEIEGEPIYAKWNKRITNTQPTEETVISNIKRFNENKINPTEKEGLTITSTNKTFGPVEMQASKPLALKGVPKAKKFDRIEPEETKTEQIEGEPAYAKWNKRNASTNPVDETVVSKNKKFDEERINPADKEGLTITSTNKTFGPVEMQGSAPIAVRGVPKAKKFDVLEPKEVITKGEIDGEPIPVRWNKENISETPIEDTIVSENKTFNIRAIKPAEREVSTITSHHKTFDPVEVQGSQPIVVRGVPKAKKFDRIEPQEGITKEIEAEPRRFKNIERGDSLSKEIEGEPTYVKWNKRITNTKPNEETVVSKNKKFDEERINPAEKEGLTITSTNKTFGPVKVQDNEQVSVKGVPKAKMFDRIVPEEGVEETVVSRKKKFDEERINPADKEGLTITSHHKTFDPVEVQGTKTIVVRGVPKAKKFDRIEPEEGVEETVVSKNKKFDVEQINPADKEGLTITSTNKTFGPVEMQGSTPIDVRGVPKAKKFDRIEPEETKTEQIEGEPAYAKWNKRNASTNPVDEKVVSKNKKFDVEQINPAEKEGLTITSTNKTFGPVEMQASKPLNVRGVAKAKKFDVLEPKEGMEETLVSKNKKFDEEQINPADKEGLTITSTNKTFGPVEMQGSAPIVVRGVVKAKKFDRIEPEEGIEETVVSRNKKFERIEPEEGIEETVVSKNKKFDEERINPADKEGLTITSTNKTFGPVEMQGSAPLVVSGVPKAKKFDRIEPEETTTEQIEGEPTYAKWIKRITNAKPVDETVVSKNKKFDEERINPAEKEGLTITSTNKTFGPVEMQASNPIFVNGVLKAKKFDRIEPDEDGIITKQIEGEPIYAKWNKQNEKEKTVKGELDGTPIAVRWNQSNITETPLQDSLSYANKHFTTINKDIGESVQVQGITKPKRFSLLQPNEANTAQIEGEPAYIKWNKRNASDKPIDDTTLISENKRFNIEQITPIDKDMLTLSSHKKCFSLLEKDNKVTTEAIEGEPIYKRWNVQNKHSNALEPSTVTSEIKRFKEEEIIKEENDNVTVAAIKKELTLSMEQIDHKLSGNTTKKYYKEKIIPIWQEEAEVNPLNEHVNRVGYVRAAPSKKEEPKSFTALQTSTPSINEFKGTSQSEKWMKAVKPNTEIKNTLTSANKQFTNIHIDNRESDVNLDGNVSSAYYKGKVVPIWSVENKVKNNEDVGVKANPQKKTFSKLEKSSAPANSINAGPRKWKRSNELSNKFTQEFLGLPKKDSNWRTSLSPEKRLSEMFGPSGKEKVVQYEEEDDEILVDDAEQYEIEDKEEELKQRLITLRVKKVGQEEQKQITEEDKEIDVLSSISITKSENRNSKINDLLNRMKLKSNQPKKNVQLNVDSKGEIIGGDNSINLVRNSHYDGQGRQSDVADYQVRGSVNIPYRGIDHTMGKQPNPYFVPSSVNRYNKSSKIDESDYYRDVGDDMYEK